MADARDNRQIYERRSVETESLSSEETTGRTPDMRLSASGRRSDERTDMMRETESRSLPEKKDKQGSILRINEAGQIPDYEHSNADTRENLQQQRRLRDEEMRRRRHETESRFWPQKRDRAPDWGRSESNWRFDGRAPNWGGRKSNWRFDDRTPDWGGSESRLRFDERTPDWGGSESRLRFYERTQRRNEQVHPGETNCRCWPCRNGCWPCRNVRSRRYNHPTHPPQELPERSDEPVCKYFRRGYCPYGSDCVLEHEMERDGAGSIYQDGTRNRRGREYEWGCDERTHRGYDIEPGFRPEKRSKIIPDPRLRERDPRERLEDISQRRQIENRSAADSHLVDPIARGIMEARREGRNTLQEQREIYSIERQRREAQENLQEQRERYSIERQKREAQENLQYQRERDSIQRQRREAQENLQYQRWRENRSAADSQLLERVARGFIDRVRREDQELNPQQQRLQEMPENDNVDAHDQQNTRGLRRNRVTRPPKRTLR